MIQGAGPSRTTDVRASTLAVRSLDHFSLAVPDLEAAARFYGRFGLGAQNVADGLQIDAAARRVARIREAPRRRLEYVSFDLDVEDAPAFVRRLEAGGIEVLEPPRFSEREALWFRDCDGVLIEAAVRRAAPASAKSTMEVRIAPEGARRATDADSLTKPHRLGHIFRFTPDVPRAIAFYERFLGLLVADRSGDIVAFLYSPHGSDHHIIAFARSARPGFHHASFEVPSVDAIGMGAMHMAQDGYTEGWGFGRHEAGSNFFHYVRDPWGSFAEYFCDMDYIPAGCAWEPRDIAPERALHLWGPVVPAYFLENFEEHA